MVTLTLNRVPEGSSEYRVIATMKIAEDGTYQLEDPEKLLPLHLPVLVTEGSAHKPGRPGALLDEVRVEQDAELWARNLKNFLRTGYLVPAVHDDDATAPKLGEPSPVRRS